MTHSPAFGSVLSFDAAGGTVYVAVGQVKDIVAPSVSRGDIEITDHDLTDGYKIFLPGLTDAGALTFVVGFDATNVLHQQGTAGLLGDFEKDGCTLPTWELVLPVCAGTAEWTFAGYMNAYTMNAPVEGEITIDVGVKISGKPVLTTE